MFADVALIILFIFDFALIYMIYFYNPTGTINRFLSLLIIPIMLSNVEIFILKTVENSFSIDIALNMAFLGGLAFFPMFYHFSYYYPRNMMTRKKHRQIVLIYIATGIVGVLLFFTYLAKPETVSQADVFHIINFLRIDPQFFVFYIIMFIYASWLLALTIRRFIKSYRLNLIPAEKRNIIMIIIGFIPTSISMIFSYFLFLPLRSGIKIYIFISSFYTIYFIILLLSFGYLDVKAVIRTLFTYPITFILIFIIFYYGLTEINDYIFGVVGIDPQLLIASEVMILIFLLLPVVRIFESRLLRGSRAGKSNFHNSLKFSAAGLSGIITRAELNVFLDRLFYEQLKITRYVLMVRSDAGDEFVPVGEDVNFRFPGNGELAGKLEGYRRIMNIQQMSLAWHEGSELEALSERKIVLMAPLFERRELIGFFLFGEPGPARAWYPSEIEELELFLTGVPVVLGRCSTHEKAIALEKKQASIEKMAVLSEISSGIAHEIRNPLSIISASAETLSSRTLSSDEIKRFSTYIQDETERMSRLLNRILSVSINTEAKHTPVNIVRIIRGTLTLVSTKLKKKNLTVDFKTEGDNIIAVIDSEVLIQICLNLILNAMDAMSDGMRLRIAVDYSEDARTRIIFANQGERIPEYIKSRIFDPFFTTKETGTGLGLSITQRLLKEASGEISLIDSEDETIFQILLPAAAGFMR